MSDSPNDSVSVETTAKQQAAQLRLISKFERQIRILFQEYYSEGIVESDDDQDVERQEELLQEQLEALRSGLLESLKDTFSKAHQDAPAKAYEEIVFSLAKDRLTRSLGYYQALRRAEALCQTLNNEVGDAAFSVEIELTKLLEKLDEVYFVRQLAASLGIWPEDADKIVNYQIEREFKPKNKK